MKKTIGIIYLFLVAYIIVACKPEQSAIFQDESCSAPCWNQITPGETLLQGIDAKIKTIPGIDPKSLKIKTFLQMNDGIAFNFLSNAKESGGEIFSQNNIVEAIYFWPKTDTLSLSEGFQKWGSPDQYISIYYSSAEIPYLVTFIIYSDRGIVLLNMKTMSDSEVPKFEKNLQINGLWYTSAKLISTLLENGVIGHIGNKDFTEGLKSWNGLKEIQYIKR